MFPFKQWIENKPRAGVLRRHEEGEEGEQGEGKNTNSCLHPQEQNRDLAEHPAQPPTSRTLGEKRSQTPTHLASIKKSFLCSLHYL